MHTGRATARSLGRGAERLAGARSARAKPKEAAGAAAAAAAQ